MSERGRVLLVIVTESNIQIHDLLDNAILYVYTIEGTEFETIRGISPENFANGITFLHNTQSILVGLVNGSLLSLNTTDIDGNGIVSKSEVTGNVEPIMDIFALKSLIAIGYSSGKSCVLEVKRKRTSSMATIIGSSSSISDPSPFHLNLLVQFESFNGFPCTNVCLCSDNLLIASYGSGHIRIFSIAQKRLLSEVYGHKSWINSLHLVPSYPTGRKSCGKTEFDEEKGSEIVPLQKMLEEGEEDEGPSDLERRSQLILSASDDSFIRVWKVNQYYPWIQLEWSTSVKNKLLVGARFLHNSPNMFAVTSYDTNQVQIYGRKHRK